MCDCQERLFQRCAVPRGNHCAAPRTMRTGDTLRVPGRRALRFLGAFMCLCFRISKQSGDFSVGASAKCQRLESPLALRQGTRFRLSPYLPDRTGRLGLDCLDRWAEPERLDRSGDLGCWGRWEGSGCLARWADLDYWVRSEGWGCWARLVDLDYWVRWEDSDCSDRSAGSGCPDRSADSDYSDRPGRRGCSDLADWDSSGCWVPDCWVAVSPARGTVL